MLVFMNYPITKFYPKYMDTRPLFLTPIWNSFEKSVLRRSKNKNKNNVHAQMQFNATGCEIKSFPEIYNPRLFFFVKVYIINELNLCTLL